MPSLRDTQNSMRDWLLPEADSDPTDQISNTGIGARQRLNVYRNTILGTLSKALRLSFPAVGRLVGPDFFEGAARSFVREHPPRCADLNGYGAEFADFLQHFGPARSVPYLPDIARLEWAVNRALHAPDVEPFEVSTLQALEPDDQDRVSLVPHPSISMVRSEYPVDKLWRAVLQQDDPAMAAIDLQEGPAFLLVERVADEIDVFRLDAGAWRFAAALFGGDSLETALHKAPDIDAPALLACHLMAGRCASFRVAPSEARR